MAEGAREFPTSPCTFEDGAGRQIDLDPLAGPGGPSIDALVDMYLDLDGRCRAMGIPPVTEPDIRDWLGGLEDGMNLIATTDGRPIGHAALLPGGDRGFELAIFVHQDFQNAGIGTALCRTLLGDARREGITDIWLSVSCGNGPAKRLFRSLGFSVVERSRRQLTMEMELSTSG